MKFTCGHCNKDISMDVEFGTAYYFSSDGDSYCSKDHHDKCIDRITREVESGEYFKQMEKIINVQ